MNNIAVAAHIFKLNTQELFWIIYTAVFLLLIVLVYCLYSKVKNKYHQQKEVISVLRKRNFEQEELIHCMAELGNISYFISNAAKEHSADTKITDAYITNMLPADQSRFQENYQMLLTGKLDKFSGNYTIKQRNQYKRHRDLLKAITLPDSNYRKIILAVMDVSNLEASNTQLLDTGLLVQAIFDNLPGSIFMKKTSSDFAYLRCNSTFSSLLNKKPEEIVNKTDFELFDRQLATRIRAVDMELIRTHTIADNRWFFTTPDGNEHAVRVISRIFKRSDGSEYILGMGLDINKQESIASKLRKRNKELRLLLSQQDKPVMLLNSQLNLVCATSNMQKAFSNYLKADMTLNCRDLCRQKVVRDADCPAWQALKDGISAKCSNCVLSDRSVNINVLDSENSDDCYLALSISSPPSEE
ncbi:MAG: hypothetical protein E7052_07445 [Lentisphaerae bacterium]|nr:hypothetical protein [Lentisphaerota bacterium]